MNYLDQLAVWRTLTLLKEYINMSFLKGYKTYIIALVSIIVFLLKPLMAQHGVSDDAVNMLLQMLGFGAIATFRLGVNSEGWKAYLAAALGIIVTVSEMAGIIDSASATQLNALLFGGGVAALKHAVSKAQEAA